MDLDPKEMERETHGFLVEVEHGRAEKLLAFGEDLVGGGTIVRRRREIERRDFRTIGDVDAIVGFLLSFCERGKASFPSRKLSFRKNTPRQESLHFFSRLFGSRENLSLFVSWENRSASLRFIT